MTFFAINISIVNSGGKPALFASVGLIRLLQFDEGRDTIVAL
jgi:hypothetical protein